MFIRLAIYLSSFTDPLHSRQIRPPIYSLKQTKLRKRRVVRFAILYFTLFFLFMVLLISPSVIVNLFLLYSTFDCLYCQNFIYLIHPINCNNNYTTISNTGIGLPNQAAQTAAKASASSTRRAMLAF